MQRVGVIGLGPIGNRHASIYAAMSNAELVGVCDMDRERADATAARLGVKAFYSVQEMLDGAELDMASVATGGKNMEATTISRRSRRYRAVCTSCARSRFPMRSRRLSRWWHWPRKRGFVSVST